MRRPAPPRAPLLWAALLLWPAAARAYRPFDSTDAAVADAGELELEIGPLGWLHAAGGDSLVVPSLVANWGFASGWEAVVEGRHVVRLGGAGPEGLLDPGVSVKAVVRPGTLQGRPGPSLALEPGLLLPEIGGEEGLGALLTGILSQRWTAVTVHLDAAAGLSRAHAALLAGGLVLEGPGAWALRPVAELFAEGERGRTAVASALAGAIWRLGERLSLDAAVRAVREAGEAALELRAGLTWSIDLSPAR